jgi:radical SAM protein with 4Fe4S-binding SPASM domain
MKTGEIGRVADAIRYYGALSLKNPAYVRYLVGKKARFLKRQRWMEKNQGGDDKVPPPLVYELTLTSECNLDCGICGFWDANGFCQIHQTRGESKEIEWGTLDKFFGEVNPGRPYYILHGGEPLAYSRIKDVVRRLEADRCFFTISTNGVLLDTILELIVGNPYADVLINNPFIGEIASLEGGKTFPEGSPGGVMRKVENNIKKLKSKNPAFHVGIYFTVTAENVGKLYDACKRLAELGVDWVLLSPPYFLTEAEERRYEDFMAENFNIRPRLHRRRCMPYSLDLDAFSGEYARIAKQRWPMKVSCYFNEPKKNMGEFVESDRPLSGYATCYKQWMRMDINPDGKVCPCIRYQDLVAGDLSAGGALGIWNSEVFAKLRGILRQKQTPVCKKCNCLYLYNKKRRVI